MGDNLLDIRYLIGVLRRRWWLLAIPLVLGGMLSVVVAYAIPPVYRSAALVAVESQQIPENLARSTVSGGVSERVRLIQQRLTARQNMLDLAGQFGVFAARDDLSPTERVQLMRESVRISSQGVGRRRNETVTTVEIAFEASDPTVASQVANALLTQLLEQNAQQRSARASETLDFFDAEVARLGGEIGDLEERIARFKNENQGALPESLSFRRSELTTLQNDMFARETERLQLEERKRVLEEQIELGRVSGAGGAVRPSRERQQLDDLRSTLAQQRAIYAETHPTIRSLVARIAALEESVSAAPSLAAAADDAQRGGVGESVDLVAEVERIEAAIGRLETQAEIDAARMEELRESISRTPQVEIRLGALEREFVALQAQYEQALRKQADAETGERLEVNRQAERLEVIEQPQVPEEPIAPNRVLIAGAGGVLSVGLGVALMVLAELLNPALRTARDLERALEIRPVAMIPYIRTRGEDLRRRWLVRLGVLALLVIPPIALFLADQYILPLPVLAERLLERTGLESVFSVLRNRFGG